MKDLTILIENMKGTNWNNIREEEGKIMGDYYGDITYAIGGGRYQNYGGTTPCELRPRKILLEEKHDYGFDQHALVMRNLDFAPVGTQFNF
jgi:hypothetical protein